ncbi:DUF3108 domain-containing protein [Candidatus Cardinium hertigii]|jgi:hypothetical protein|nr:DUF3108 domain-containing protein [Candidatus Cardinium hertigii]
MGFLISNADAQVTVPPFRQGEWLEYQVSYGYLSAGTATMGVDEQLHEINGHACYKIQIKGVSASGLELLNIKVDNTWESYLDVDLLRPHKFIEHIQEHNYTKKNQTDFDYKTNQARVEIAESTNNMQQEVTYFPIPNHNIKDLVSAYYSMRSIDTTHLKPGDTFVISGLYEKKIYENIVILFLGKKVITTKLGKIEAMVFAPLIPVEDSIFTGNRPVEIFISNDANKIPLKLKVNLMLGAVEMELSAYKGLKEEMAFQKP